MAKETIFTSTKSYVNYHVPKMSFHLTNYRISSENQVLNEMYIYNTSHVSVKGRANTIFTRSSTVSFICSFSILRSN
jgi:hypothetical protein